MMIDSKEDHVLRQAYNLLQLLPTCPQEAFEVLAMLRVVMEATRPYYDPPRMH